MGQGSGCCGSQPHFACRRSRLPSNRPQRREPPPPAHPASVTGDGVERRRVDRAEHAAVGAGQAGLVVRMVPRHVGRSRRLAGESVSRARLGRVDDDGARGGSLRGGALIALAGVEGAAPEGAGRGHGDTSHWHDTNDHECIGRGAHDSRHVAAVGPQAANTHPASARTMTHATTASQIAFTAAPRSPRSPAPRRT